MRSIRLRWAVGNRVVRDERFAATDRGDDGLNLPFGEHGAERIGVVGFVGEQPQDDTGGRNQHRSDDDVMGVAGAQEQNPRPPLGIAQRMDFGCPPRERPIAGSKRPLFRPRPSGAP